MSILKTLFSLNYYTGVLAGKNKFRWILAILILAIIIAIQPSIFVVTKVYPVVRDLENRVTALADEVYPEDLEIKIKNGIATTNVTEPYYLVVRQETLNSLLSLREDDQNTVSKIRLLAIDTKGKAEEFEQYQTLALLTQTSLVYNSDDKVNIHSLREIEDLTINKTIILAKIKEFNKEYNIGNLLNIFVLAAPLLIVLGIFSSHIYLFLFMSIAVYIMVRITQVQTGFKKTYRYTVAIGFLPIFLWNIASFVPIIGRNLSLTRTMLTIIILVIAYLGIKKLKLPRPNGRGFSSCASSELKSAEAENGSASHDLTIGDFREGGLKQEQAESPLESPNKDAQTASINPEVKPLNQVGSV